MQLALDVSNNRVITAAQARTANISLLIAKATEGSDFADDTLAAHRKVAADLGIRFGSYLFLHANAKGDQADFYLKYAKPRPGELVVIDSEPGGQDGASIQKMAARTQSCALELERHDHTPILYASASYWGQLVACEPTLRRLRVWEAQYPGHPRAWSAALARLRWRLGRGATCVLWQFSDSYAVDGRGFDASRILVPLHKL